jgi:hypothetical protein
MSRVIVAGLLLACVACGEPDPSPPADAPAEPAPPACEEPVPRERAAPLAARLGDKIEAAAGRCIAAPMAADDETDHAATGVFEGRYLYDDPGRGSTRIEATLNVREGTLQGTMTEPNTFGDPGYAELVSELVGQVNAARHVVFMKTYTNAGQDHSVLYIGELDPERHTITGRWTVGDLKGTFELTRKEWPGPTSVP